jgi:hypothetical protein
MALIFGRKILWLWVLLSLGGGIFAQTAIVPVDGRLVLPPGKRLKQAQLSLDALFDGNLQRIGPENKWDGLSTGGQPLRLLFDLGNEFKIETLFLHLGGKVKPSEKLLVRFLGLSTVDELGQLVLIKTEQIENGASAYEVIFPSTASLRYLEMEFYPSPAKAIIQLAEIRIEAYPSEPGPFHQGGLGNTLLDNPWIDCFGQYARERWAGKIVDSGQLKVQGVLELEQIKNWQASSSPPAEGSGNRFFSVETRDGRWSLMDSHGQPFYVIGVDGVLNPLRSGNKALPQAFFVNDCTPPPEHFYLNNLELKYGEKFRSTWQQNTLMRLDLMGFNTIGKWSPVSFCKSSINPYPYMVTLRVKEPAVSMIKRRGGGGAVADIFAPDFEQNVMESLETQINTLGLVEDTRLIGYLVNNEEAWDWHLIGDIVASPGSPALAGLIEYLARHFEEPPQDVLRRWGVKQVKKAFKDPSQEMKLKGPPPESVLTEMNDFIEYYAGSYFSVIARALKMADPNHLYLGNSIGWMWSPGALRACATYADVVSLDHYSTEFDTRYFQQISQTIPNTPLLLAEFGFTLAGHGMGYKQEAISDAETRGRLYEHFLTAAMAHPELIGVCYYTLKDDELAGKDGQFKKNRAFGFVNTADQLDSAFTVAAREAHKRTLEAFKMN